MVVCDCKPESSTRHIVPHFTVLSSSTTSTRHVLPSSTASTRNIVQHFTVSSSSTTCTRHIVPQFTVLSLSTTSTRHILPWSTASTRHIVPQSPKDSRLLLLLITIGPSTSLVFVTVFFCVLSSTSAKGARQPTASQNELLSLIKLYYGS